jgi:hypothetical protein
MNRDFGRVLRTGLSRLRRLAASRLAPPGFNPSRSATVSLRSYPNGHEVIVEFDTRDEAEAFFDYLERVAP